MRLLLAVILGPSLASWASGSGACMIYMCTISESYLNGAPHHRKVGCSFTLSCHILVLDPV